MKKRKVNALLAIVLSLTMLVGVTGCGKEQQLEAEINPDTPATEVQFPLKETAELSFITSAPATSTQEPNERVIFQRMEEQTNVHIDWTCFVSDQFSDKKNLALAQFGNLPDGLFNAGMSDYDLLRYAKQGIIIPLENLILTYQQISTTALRITIAAKDTNAPVLTDIRRITIFNTSSIESPTLNNTTISTRTVLDDLMYTQSQESHCHTIRQQNPITKLWSLCDPFL